MSEGLNSLTVTATDAINNVSAASSVLSITVDTTAPDQPAITTTTALTSDATPTIEGVAEAGSTVTLFVDGVTTGITETADVTTGIFSLTAPSQEDGTYSINVQTPTQDGYGAPLQSASISLIIDTSIDKPVITTTSSDLDQKDATPTIEGTCLLYTSPSPRD